MPKSLSVGPRSRGGRERSIVSAAKPARGRLQAGLPAQVLARKAVVLTVPYDALRSTAVQRVRIGGSAWHGKIALYPNGALAERAGNEFGEFADFAKSKGR